MKTQPWAIILVLFITALTSSAQLLYKLGADRLSSDLLMLLSNWPLLLGMLVYAIGAVLLIIALKHGEVTILYPIIATSYIWVALFSWLLFGESISYLKLMGIISIVVGIVLISFGSKQEGVIAYEEAV